MREDILTDEGKKDKINGKAHPFKFLWLTISSYGANFKGIDEHLFFQRKHWSSYLSLLQEN